MAEDVKKLLLQIDASTELLRREVSRGSDTVERFERDTKRRLNSVDRSFNDLGRGVDTLKGRFAGLRGMLAAIGLSFGIAQLTGFIRSSFQLAASLIETSQQLGVSTRALQVYRYIGQQSGIATETMDRALGKLNQTLGRAALGAAGPTRQLRAFGFSLAEIRRGLTVEQAFPRIADGLSRVESSSRRAAVEVAFFGRAGQALDPLLSQGGRRINELSDAADRLGLVLSDEQLQRLDEAADKYDALKTLLSAQIAALIADNIDAILSLIQALGDLISYAARAGDAWRNFRLELRRGGIVAMLGNRNLADPPEWGTGGRGQAMTLPERRQLLDELQRIDAERLEIARRADPSYRPPAPPRTPRPTARPPTPDLDNWNAAATNRRPTPERTAAQAWRDFAAALASQGVRPASGRYGFRTARDQAQIHAQGESPLDGTRRVSRHQTHQAFDPSRATQSDEAARTAASQAGLRGFRIVNESGGRKHYEWTGHSAQRGDLEVAIDEQERQDQEATRERERALRETFQYDSELRRAQGTTLGAMRDLATDHGVRAELSTRMLDLERQQEFEQLDLQVTMGERTQAQADALKAEYDIADRLRFEAIQLEAANARREEFERLTATRVELARSLLEGEGQLATTAAERRRIELRMVELAYQEERARLQRIIALNRGDADEAEARQRLGALDAQTGQRREQARRNNRSPLETYFASLPRTAEELNEAFESVAANGLQALNDGIVDAIMGAKSLGEMFKAVANQIIADLLRIAVQKAITEGLSAIFGGGGGGGGFLGGLFGGGGSSAPGGDWFSNLKFGGPKAIGGGVSPNRIYQVGERGVELFQPSVPGQIIPNDKLPGAGGVSASIIYQIDARGADRDGINLLRAEMDARERALPAKVVGVVDDAIKRRFIR
jgi:Lambda phage tail tape-measure protein (Tape_meas_lam_C)